MSDTKTVSNVHKPAITGLRVIPSYGDGSVHIVWSPYSSESISVLRSETGGATWELIGVVSAGVGLYIDTTSATNNLVIHNFYKLISSSGVESQMKSANQSTNKMLNGMVNFLAHETLVSMRSGSGTLVKMLIPSNTGEVCTHCTDPLTLQIFNSHCPICNGTGRILGYTACVTTYIRFASQDVIDTQKSSPQGSALVKKFVVTCFNIPAIMEGYVFVHEATDNRYIVDSMKVSKLAGTIPVLVEAEVTLLNRDHPVYKVQV